jgi:asparagine synthase (glutamine-hydrolysing)
MKVDKSAMRASLEARVPFLNTSVVEHAQGIPADFKIRRFKGKYLLRLVAQRYLPKDLVWRKKHGFIVPWERWVRDPGNAALTRLLEDSGLSARGLFDMARLREFRAQLCAGSREVEAGLFFRIAVLGLYLESLTHERLVVP